jgi:uncharacterized membrane protein YidH (DUF202 family)
LTDVAILPLALIPFAFGYSVLRYRLMDVELVVRRVFVYALTTLAIALLIGVVVYLGGLYAFGSDQSFNAGEITLRVVAAVLAMAAVVMVAAPVKNFLQEHVDRLFYGERYDLRNSLLDFGRTLSATTALEPLLDSLVNRLKEVMNVERIAIFVGLPRRVWFAPMISSSSTNRMAPAPCEDRFITTFRVLFVDEWSPSLVSDDRSMVDFCRLKMSRYCALFRVTLPSRSKTVCFTKTSRHARVS